LEKVAGGFFSASDDAERAVGVESWLLGSLGDSFGPFEIREADEKDVPFFFAHECANRIDISDSTFHFGGDANVLKQAGGCRSAADRAG
jgi:hypothetical protein